MAGHVTGSAGICKNLERVTRIELALSAWEAQRLRLPEALTWCLGGSGVTVVDPSLPRLMAR